MGTRGPIGKRAGQTRRRNKKSVTTAESGSSAQGEVQERKPNSKWHPIAKQWYLSLSESGQSQFYEESDWATAYFTAEAMSRELGLQTVGRTADGKPIRAHVPIKGTALNAISAMMTKLLATEGDRRRVALELTKPADADSEGGGADVSNLDEYRQRLMGSPS